ncbi:MAG: LLM class flavin-dependent oxidoreductase, partial [Dehalococcoidia bacterium]
SEAKPSFHGRFVQFEGVQAYPQPFQRPSPPIVFGGRSPAAYRRAVQHARGWYGFALDLDATAEAVAGLRRAATRFQRPAKLGELEISVSPRGPVDLAVAERFAALGVHRLILLPPRGADAAGLEQFVGDVAGRLIGRV